MDDELSQIMPNFAISYLGDAYSTANKIMGRQSVGKTFMKGVAQAWPQGTITGVGVGEASGRAMLSQLQGDGFSGKLRWFEPPNWQALEDIGCLYYPSPASPEFAHSRNMIDPGAFSIMGVTFTLCSKRVTDQIANLILPPFKPWDAMICISQAALDFSNKLQSEMKDWWGTQTGANQFNTPHMPVIPQGIDSAAFTLRPGQKAVARSALGIADDDVVLLFAGRLSFHDKVNFAPMYQAFEKIAGTAKIVCIEAGIYPNDITKERFEKAQAALAPSVRFIWANGKDESEYKRAWQSADVFVSTADNIQETFGLTPIEAMAAGLPVVISDWNGYKETVRDGIDGFRIPTILPPGGAGMDIAMRHALGVDSFDYYIGRTSAATVVDPVFLEQALMKLATSPELRSTLGANGVERAVKEYDWQSILPRYVALADDLNRIRKEAKKQIPEPWVTRGDPFSQYAHFPTQTLQGVWTVTAQANSKSRIHELFELEMASFAFDEQVMPKGLLVAIMDVLEKQHSMQVNTLLGAAGAATQPGVRALMWLWKFDLIKIR